MASVKKQDIPVEAALFPALWEYVKKYYIPEDADEYWDSLLADAEVLNRKYPSELGQKLIAVYVEYLDGKWRKRKDTRDNLA